jgi:hypothetical protein
MKTEKQTLLHDLLGEEDRRAATLLAGARVLRRRRRLRVAARALPLALLMAAAAFWVARVNVSPPSPRTVANDATPADLVQARSLTDDELLALFPDVPVGLATLSDGTKRLIFPRPGDQERFITGL